MILVTVGTHFLGFDRLVRAADELARELDETIIIQYGSSSYVPQYAEGFTWTSSQQMEKLTQDARVVVTHAAAGAIILALKGGKPLIVVPRKKLFNEHIDDHQMQLCEVLNKTGRAVTVENPSAITLKEALMLTSHSYPPYEKPIMLQNALRNLLSNWESTG